MIGRTSKVRSVTTAGGDTVSNGTALRLWHCSSSKSKVYWLKKTTWRTAGGLLLPSRCLEKQRP